MIRSKLLTFFSRNKFGGDSLKLQEKVRYNLPSGEIRNNAEHWPVNSPDSVLVTYAIGGDLYISAVLIIQT